MRSFFHRIRWQLLSFLLPIAIIPVIFLSTFSTSRIFTHLNQVKSDFYSELLKQVAKNVDFVYERYAMTLADITFMENFQKIVNYPQFISAEEERQLNFLIGELGDDPEGGNIRRKILSNIMGDFVIIQLDKFSHLTKRPYLVNFYTDPRVIINVEQLIQDPMFLELKSNPGMKCIFGKLQSGVLSGYESELKPVIIFPYRQNETTDLVKIILIIFEKQFLPTYYREIEKLHLGTLYILDQKDHIVCSNHPGEDDYYTYDTNSETYIVEDGDDNIDPFNKMRYSEYLMLNTDKNILQHETIKQILHDINQGINKPEEYSYSNPLQYDNIKIIKYHNQKFLTIVNYAPLSKTKFVYFHPLKQIHGPIYQIIFIIIIASIIVIIMVVLVSLIISKRLTDPIKSLSVASEQLARGNYKVQVDSSVNNELGTLALSFNSMVKEVKNYAENLEDIVKQRTDELNITNKKLIEANIDLMGKNKFKSRYLANMSHEIRTPLTAIIGNNELLQFGGYDVVDALEEINEQILVCADNDGKKDDIMQELHQFCADFKSLIFDDKKNMEDYFVEKINSIVSKDKRKVKSSLEDPLFPVRSYILAVKDLQKEKDNKIIENLDTTNRLGKFLINLIESILDIAKIEAGRILLHPEQVDLREFIEGVYADALSYRKAKGKGKTIKMQHEIDRSVPDSVFIDRNKIKQVLLNLISNAIKFTKKGIVTLRVQVDDSFLVFLISDTGIGIKDEDKDILFKEFSRASNSKKVEGTGLGLALSKMLVELHQGKITVQSEYQKGSEFTVRIPIFSLPE